MLNSLNSVRVGTLILGLLLASCRSTERDLIQTPRPFGNTASLYDYGVDLQIGPSKVQGKAGGGVVLWLWRYGAGDYHEGLVYTPGGVAGPAGKVFPLSGRLAEVKSAAVRDACDRANCDILAYPMFEVKRYDGWISHYYTVTVTGFPGTLNSVTNYQRQVKNGVVDFGSMEPSGGTTGGGDAGGILSTVIGKVKGLLGF